MLIAADQSLHLGDFRMERPLFSTGREIARRSPEFPFALLAANDAAWRRAKALATECLKARGAPSEVSKHFRHTAELLLNHG